MKRIFILAIFIAAFTEQSYSQCSATPVEEAVRNGDFEDGYLGAGGATDFYSDFTFGGSQFSGTGAGTCGCCQYGMGDQYAVAKAENFTCAGTNFTNNTYWGISYGGDVNFNDHTTAAGDGYALLVDLNSKTTSQKTGGKPIAWEQTVNIYPSQNYWFSAYVANFSTGTAPVMQVTVIPELAGVQDLANKIILPATGTPAGLMNWTQMTAQWTPVGIYDKVTLSFEFVNTGGGSSGLDVAIDDISFINSCQNFASQNKPTLNADTVNLCSTAGIANLIATYPSSGNETYAWFDGTSNPQTTIAGVTGLTHSVTNPGTYRICVQDPDNSCATNDVVVVMKGMTLSLPDVVLCSPVTAAINVAASLTPTGAYTKNYVWTVPGGETDPGNSGTANFTTAGNYSVSVTNPSTSGCSVTENFTITSTLPVAPTNLNYCSGGGVQTTLTVGDGKSYLWSTSNTLSPAIGTGTSVPWTPAGGTTGNQTLYIQNSNTSPLGTTVTQGVSWYAVAATQTITVTQTVLLSSVTATFPNYAVGIAEQLTVGGTIVNFTSAATSTIAINKLLTPGTYTISLSSGNGVMTVANPSGTIAGYVSVTGGATGSFNNFVFETSQACDPVAVIVKDSVCCTQLSPTATQDQTEVCVGTAVTLTATPDGATTGPITYQWYSDAGIIAGATGITYSVPNGSPLVATDFWVTVTTSASCAGESPTSNTVNVIINPAPTTPTITINPNQTTFCENEVHDLTAVSTITGGGTITYQWSMWGTGLLPANTVTTANQTGTVTPDGVYTYKVVVNAAGCKDSVEQIITVSPLDSAKITVDTVSTCANVGNIDLTQYLTAGSSVGTWSGTGVAGTDFSTAQAAGVYKQVFTTGGTCPATDSMYVNVIATVEAQIIQVDTSVCMNTASFGLPLTAGSATDGVWSGTGYSAGSFDPTGLSDGPYKIKYVKNGISAACSDSDSVTVTILPLDVALIATPLPSLCSTDFPVQLTLDGTSTTGGVWADSLGASTYINAAGLFDPFGLADGNYKVYYATLGGCPGVDSGYVAVVSDITYNKIETDTTLCLNYGLDTLKVDIAGGVIWTASGTGVVNAADRVINTLLMPVGIDTLYYGKSGSCGDTIQYVLTIEAIDVATIDTINPLCIDTTLIGLTITGPATGGTFAGPGVTGSDFNPATAGSGTHMITYTTTGNCPIIDSTWITVHPRKVATITANQAAFCGAATADTLFSAQSGGTWSGWTGSWSLVSGQDSVILFDPNVQSGINMMYYEIVDICGAIDSIQISVTAMEIANIDSVVAVCADAPAFTFTIDAGSTPGGTWTDGSATNTYIDAAGLFDPTTAGPGTHVVKYQTPGGCFVRDSVSIVVKPRMDATLSPAIGLTFCEGDLVTQTITGVDGGGIFTGWVGAHTSAVANVLTFAPAVSGSGDQYLLYSIDESAAVCGDTDSVQVFVGALDVAVIDGDSLVCQASTAADLRLVAGFTPGGTWSGLGITNTTTGTFDPSTVGLGVGSGNQNTVTYTTTGGCAVVAAATIEIVSSVDVIIDAVNTDTVLCSNQTTDLTVIQTGTVGGSWSTNPVTSPSIVDASNGVVSIIAMAAAASNKYWIKYEAGPGGSCYDADSIEVRMITVADPQITSTQPAALCLGEGSHQFTGSDGENWAIFGAITGSASIDGSALFTFTQADTYTATYSHTGEGECPITSAPATLIVVDTVDAAITVQASLCANLAAVTVGSSTSPAVTDGIWTILDGTTLVSGPSTGSISVSPGALGAGNYTITHTTTNQGVCPQTKTIPLQIDAVPTPLITAVDPSVCLGQPIVYQVDNGTSVATSAVWVFQDGNLSMDSLNQATVTHTTSNTNDKTVTLSQEFSNGCKVTESINIAEVDALPIAAFTYSPTKTTVLDPKIQFVDSSINAGTLEWSFGRTATPAASSLSTPFVDFETEDGDTINVCLIAISAASGCPDTVCKDVIILNNVSIYVPNSFTPNGDGLNDVFYPLGKYHDNAQGLSEYNFTIYNRWGEAIFNSTTPYKGWDAIYMNDDVQQEVYVWVITVFDPLTLKTTTKNGTVTVVK